MEITQIISSEKFKKSVKLLSLVTGIIFLCAGILLLLPSVQNLVFRFAENFLLHRLLRNVDKWQRIIWLLVPSMLYSGFYLILVFNNFKLGLLNLILLLLLPIYMFVYPITSGLDFSWFFALNYSAANGIFYPNWSFTWGPLGFLIYPQNLGNNIFFVQIFWLTVTFVFGYMLHYIFMRGVKKNNKHISCLIFILLLWGFSKTYHDYVMVFIATIALLLAYFENRKFIFIFDIIFSISIFMKFTMVIFMCSAIFPLILLDFVKNKKSKFFIPVNLVVSFLCSAFFFMIFYEHSLFSFYKYIRGALEASSGYNVAMSRNQYDSYLSVALIMALLYCMALIDAFKNNQKNFATLLVFVFPLFLIYKHGFISGSSHMFGFFSNFCICIVIVFLFFDWEQISFTMPKISKSKLYLLIVFLFSMYSFKTLPDLIQIPLVKTVKSSAANYLSESTQKLPPSAIEKIGDKSVSIYPWEISYIADTNLRYKQMPTFQAYSSYTPYLDNLNAEFYSNGDVPEFIIFSAETIHDRWAFIENPATWQAIYKNYEFDSEYEKFILLKRKTNLRAKKSSQSDLKLLDKRIVSKKESIQVKNKIVAINAKLSLCGKLVKILWKIPAVNMTCTFSGGKKETHRILLDNLINGYDFKNIFRGQNLAEYFSTFDSANEITEIAFSGSGLKFYKKNFIVFFYTED